MMKWQPIDTAPKDGTIVMGCDYDYGVYQIYKMKLDKDYGWIDPNWDGGYRPTHWMPLPPTPK